MFVCEFHVCQTTFDVFRLLYNAMRKVKPPSQGFSTFKYLRTPKSKFTSSAYPQTMIVPLCVPPNKKFHLNMFVFYISFYFSTNFELPAYPCELLAYP